MNTNIDKKAFCVTEVNTPVELDKSTISRYATQVVFGSKLKEMLDSGSGSDVETPVKTKEPVVETKEPVVETKEPVAETKEPVAETKEPVVETKEPVVETKEPVVETPVETTQETTQETTSEEITVDEEGV